MLTKSSRIAAFRLDLLSPLQSTVQNAWCFFHAHFVRMRTAWVPSQRAVRTLPETATNEKIHPPASLRKGGFSKRESRHLPIFAGRLQPTIFGTTELNFCVRNGNRWNLCVIGTGQICFKPGLHIFSFNLRDAPSKLNITANSQMEYLKIVVKPSTY